LRGKLEGRREEGKKGRREEERGKNDYEGYLMFV
jgi:hypothetical protein